MSSSELQRVHAEARAGRIPKTNVSRERLVEFCTRWGVMQLGVFGSILREDFGPDSDIDILVSLDPNRRYTLFDLVDMEHDLEEMYGRKVDVVEREGIEASENQFRKKLIFDSLEIVYEFR